MFAIVKSCANAPRLLGRGLVKIYRYTLSGFVGFECRHLPTCSEYADQAIDRFGLVGRRLDDAGAAVALPSLGHVPGSISCRNIAGGRALVSARGVTAAGAASTTAPPRA